jgi:flagellar hook-length control protein FliK
MLTAVAPAAAVQVESASEPTVREAPEMAFGEVVARAVAKSRARDAREARSEEPVEAESGDATLCAYVAALASQSPAIPLPPQPDEATGDVANGTSAQGGAASPLPVARPEAQSNAANQLPTARPEAQGMPHAQVASGVPEDLATPAAPRFGTQALAPQLSGDPTPLSPQRTQVEQITLPNAQPSVAGQAVLVNPQIRKAQTAEAVTSLPQRPGEVAGSDAVGASPKPGVTAPGHVAGRSAAGDGSASAEPSVVIQPADRYAQVQALAEKAASFGKAEATERASSAEGAAPRPVEERRAPQQPVLPTQRNAEPLLRADKPAEAQRPETAPSPREVDTAAQLFRATTSALSRGETSYRLKLRPEGLGEVTVAISTRDRELHLTIRTQSESTREIILNQIGALKLELASSDYHLSGFSVDVSGGGAGGETFSAFQGGQERRSAGGGRQPEPRTTPVADAPWRGAAPELRAGTINLRV